MDDEKIRLILELLGTEDIGEAVKALEDLKRTTQEAAKNVYEFADHYELATHEVTHASDEAVRAAVEQTRSYVASMQVINDATVEMLDRKIKPSYEQLAQANSALGRGILQTSYAVQDFTSVLSGGGGLDRALSSVQNNIPVLLTGLGMGAGLAGAVSLVSVGVGLAVPKIQSFFGAMDPERAKAAAEESKKLADQMERMANLRTPEQEKAAKSFESYLKGGEGRGRVIQQGIEAAMSSDLATTRTPDEQALLDATGGSVASALMHPSLLYNAMRSRSQRRLGLHDEAGRIATTLGTDPSSRAAAADLARRYPGNFPPEFIQHLRDAEPDRIKERAEQVKDIERQQHESNKDVAQLLKRREELTEEGRRNEEIWRHQMEAGKDKDKKHQERLRETLNREGGHNEDMWRSQMERDRKHDEQETKRKAREAAQEAKRTAREQDPSNQLHRQQEAVRDEVSAEVLNRWQEAGRPMNEDLPAITRQAIEDLPQTGGNVAAAVQWAIQQVHQKMVMDDLRAADQIMRYAGRMDSVSPYAPSFMPRSQ